MASFGRAAGKAGAEGAKFIGRVGTELGQQTLENWLAGRPTRVGQALGAGSSSPLVRAEAGGSGPESPFSASFRAIPSPATPRIPPEQHFFPTLCDCERAPLRTLAYGASDSDRGVFKCRHCKEGAFLLGQSGNIPDTDIISYTGERERAIILENRLRGGRRIKGTRRKTVRRHQKGGFYPSVMEGVRGAALLTPLALRQAYRLMSNRKTRSGTRRRKSKRTTRKR